MSLSEALSEGLQVTGVGLLIVFSVLAILMLVMMAMKKIFYKDPQKTSAGTKAAEVQSAPAASSTPSADTAPAEDPNLIAVLTAAVAASLNTSTYKLNIKSYRRADSNSPAWKKAGLSDVIDSRF